jgi:hypothetical protein
LCNGTFETNGLHLYIVLIELKAKRKPRKQMRILAKRPEVDARKA